MTVREIDDTYNLVAGPVKPLKYSSGQKLYLFTTWLIYINIFYFGVIIAFLFLSLDITSWMSF